MDHRPLALEERRRLIAALRGNGEGRRVLLMDPLDTTFVGEADEVSEGEVINAVSSVPCHY
jgi:hypothetical protein